MNTALHGKRILVTRPSAQAGPLARAIAAQGGEALRFALLEIAPAADDEPLQQAIARLDDYALAIFISPNAVHFSVPHILAHRPWPPALHAAAVGPGTAAELSACGITELIVPSQRFDSEALLELPALHATRVAGKKVLILRGNGGRELLAASLRGRGAEVDAITCYRRSPPADGAPLRSLLRNKRIDALTVSSSEGLRALVPLLDTQSLERLQRTPIFVPHQRIAESAAALGWKKVILTAPADAGIMEGLCAHDWLHDE